MRFRTVAYATLAASLAWLAFRGVRPARADQLFIPPGLTAIQHFVFIIQASRSFDHYFGAYPNVDGIVTPSGCVGTGAPTACVASYHDTNLINRGGPYSAAAAAASIDNGLMDGFLAQSLAAQGAGKCATPGSNCAPGTDPNDVMGYHDYHEIPNYWSYANLYVLQDRFFESVAAASLSSHLYMLAAQSGGYTGAAGQAQPASFAFPEITQFLNSGQVTWKFYAATGNVPDTQGGALTGTVAQTPQTPATFTIWNPLPAFPAVKNDSTQSSRIVDVSQFAKDAAAGALPQVSWVVPEFNTSEHPQANIQTGMAYVTGLVNAVMQSSNWNTSAIFIAWDNSGGFYDHVPPPAVDQNGFGVRVPALVIGPFVRQGYVDHKTYSFDSWLRILEERFSLTPMQPRDNQAIDLFDAFDFTQQPRPPVVLSATPAGSAYPPKLQTVNHFDGTMTNVNAANYGFSLAPGTIASAFGTNLASTTVVSSSGPQPSIGGVTVTVTDAASVPRNALLFSVSPTQINYVVPDSTASGNAIVVITSNSNKTASGVSTISNIAPALYTANGNGAGAAAALYTHAFADGTVTNGYTYTCDARGVCAPAVIDLGGPSDQVVLTLYGTGIRNRSSLAGVQARIGNESATVAFAGAQGQFAGLDQVNVVVPPDLKGRGRQTLVLTVDGQSANPVHVSF